MTEALTTTDKKQPEALAWLQEPKVSAAIQEALPQHIQFARLYQIVNTAIKENAALMMCERRSLLTAVIRCCQMGLEPNTPLGQCYLIPFKNGKLSAAARRDVYDCVLVMGYQGLIDLAYRSGQIASLEARIVGKDEEFKVEYGTNSFIKHVPKSDWMPEPAKMRAVYAVAKTVSGGTMFEVLWGEHVEMLCRDGLSKSPGGPWRNHFPAMAKKSAISRLAKLLPRSVEQSMNHFYEALALDQMGERGLPAPQLPIEGIPAEELDKPVVEGEIVIPEDDGEFTESALPLSLAIFHKGENIEIFGDDLSYAAVRSTLKNKKGGISGTHTPVVRDGKVSDSYWVAKNTEANIETLRAACSKSGVKFIESKEPQAPALDFKK